MQTKPQSRLDSLVNALCLLLGPACLWLLRPVAWVCEVLADRTEEGGRGK